MLAHFPNASAFPKKSNCPRISPPPALYYIMRLRRNFKCATGKNKLYRS